VLRKYEYQSWILLALRVEYPFLVCLLNMWMKGQFLLLISFYFLWWTRTDLFFLFVNFDRNSNLCLWSSKINLKLFLFRCWYLRLWFAYWTEKWKINSSFSFFYHLMNMNMNYKIFSFYLFGSKYQVVLLNLKNQSWFLLVLQWEYQLLGCLLNL
jgi:hypothetical protein